MLIFTIISIIIIQTICLVDLKLYKSSPYPERLKYRDYFLSGFIAYWNLCRGEKTELKTDILREMPCTYSENKAEPLTSEKLKEVFDKISKDQPKAIVLMPCANGYSINPVDVDIASGILKYSRTFQMDVTGGK